MSEREFYWVCQSERHAFNRVEMGLDDPCIFCGASRQLGSMLVPSTALVREGAVYALSRLTQLGGGEPMRLQGFPGLGEDFIQ